MSTPNTPGSKKPKKPVLSPITVPNIHDDRKKRLEELKLKILEGGGTIKPEDIEVQETLGKGQYGVVTKVIHKETGEVMAMKEIQFSENEESIKQIKRELEVLRDSDCPEIVTFYGAYFQGSNIYYCMEYMEYGSLDKTYSGGVPEPVLAHIAIAMIKGLKYLKEKLNIIHRDVKPTNVLANIKGEIKLCDFGISGQLVQSVAETYIGCANYMAPERINTTVASKYDVRSDVWSLGLSLVEIGNGEFPYAPSESIYGQLDAIVNGPVPTLKPQKIGSELVPFSKEAHDFINKCLDKDSERRPSYAQLLEMPWIKNYENVHVDLAAWLREASERLHQ